MQKSSRYKPPRSRPDQTGAVRYILILGLLFGTFMVFRSVTSHALSNGWPVKSGITGYCLDDHDNSPAPGAAAGTSACNGTAAQAWTVTEDTITHGGHCLAVQANGQAAGQKVISNTCNNDPGQIWLRDKNGFVNPNSSLCLDVPGNKTGIQLDVQPCSPQAGQIWTPASPRGGSASCMAEMRGWLASDLRRPK